MEPRRGGTLFSSAPSAIVQTRRADALRASVSRRLCKRKKRHPAKRRVSGLFGSLVEERPLMARKGVLPGPRFSAGVVSCKFSPASAPISAMTRNDGDLCDRARVARPIQSAEGRNALPNTKGQLPSTAFQLTAIRFFHSSALPEDNRMLRVIQ